MKYLPLTSMVICVAGGLAQASGPPGQPVTEADLRSAVQRVEQLAKDLRTELKCYHDHLESAMWRLGYGPYHPLFRTNVNGFFQEQFDLADFDQHKMGSLALDLKKQGKALMPDPFIDWVEIQSLLDNYQATVDGARKVVARTDIVDASSDQNISAEAFAKLKKRWREAVLQAGLAHDHAMAVRAVQFENGEMIPAESTIRLLPGGKAATICFMNVCDDQLPDDDQTSIKHPPLMPK